ncbi:acetamidase/formamidase family protein [Chachezhania sediminis]|uniref:acetamidase/formamidase family protein n=1 Tax=Chachezhania sediminis TaxID=2599291 RepID=UPI00131E1D5F|nr:acetamidase/formamidase family protein [Chachezhania sediminis]
MADHFLTSTPETVHWGWFDAHLQPVLTVDSGDTVTVEALSGAPSNLPGPGFDVPRALLDIHERAERRMPGHLLTGPIAIRDALPGDVLEVRVIDVAPMVDWGYTLFRPLAGGLPDDFDTAEQIHPQIDLFTNTARLPWGSKLDLKPFFGVMGVAPPEGWGPISTIQPRRNGGNLDNKELGAGATLFLPVHAPGALFSCGDGHGVQGDGEVCITAIETSLRGRFEFHLHKARGWDFPRAETPTHLISMGMDEDLDTAAREALRRMIDWLCELSDLTRGQAYMFLSLIGDLRITQIVNGEKGCHMMLDKAHLADLPGVSAMA